MRIHGIGLLLWCLLTVRVTAAQTPAGVADMQWLTRKESGGITVSEGQAPKDAFRYVKAQMILTASLRRLATLVMEVEGYKDWVDRTRQAYVLEKVNDTVQLYRSVIAVPLLKDRDLVAELRIRQDKGSKIVTAEAIGVKGRYPVDERFERLDHFQTTWTFVPLKGGRVRVEYVGAVPDDVVYALVKSLIWNGLHQTFANLRQLAAQPKGAGPGPIFIEDAQ